MGLLYLGIMLLVIIGLLALRRPLYQAMLGSLTVTALHRTIFMSRWVNSFVKRCLWHYCSAR